MSPYFGAKSLHYTRFNLYIYLDVFKTWHDQHVYLNHDKFKHSIVLQSIPIQNNVVRFILPLILDWDAVVKIQSKNKLLKDQFAQAA